MGEEAGKKVREAKKGGRGSNVEEDSTNKT